MSHLHISSVRKGAENRNKEIKKMFRADFLNEQFDIGIGDSTCIKEKLVLNASLPIHLLPCILEWPLL